jgi:hypothetical protein
VLRRIFGLASKPVNSEHFNSHRPSVGQQKMPHHPPGSSAHRSCAVCLGTYLEQTERNNISMSCYSQATANSRQETTLQCLLTNTKLCLSAEIPHRAVSKNKQPKEKPHLSSFVDDGTNSVGSRNYIACNYKCVRKSIIFILLLVVVVVVVVVAACDAYG